MSQAQYLNGYDDGYADAVKKIKASTGQGGGSETKVVNMPAPGGAVIDISTIPSAGMYVVADFEMGNGITLTGWEVHYPNQTLQKGSGPTIFHLVKASSPNGSPGVGYAVYTITESANIFPEER